jgi:multidrug resistance efflux pump
MKANMENHVQNQSFGHKKKSGAARWVVLVLIVAALAVTGLVAAKMTGAGSGGSSVATVTARRGDLNIVVSEAGSIRARNSIQYKVQVERRGMSADMTILSVVPPGTYVTQKDVDEGLVLVELDSSSMEDSLLQEEMSLASDLESVTSAKESYDIQVIQNESDIASGQLRVRFALMDLQKYVGAELAEEMVRDVNDAANLTAHVAPFIERVRNEPNLLDGSGAGQSLKRYNDDIVLAEGNLKTSEATLVGTRRLHDANYVSDLDLQRDELTKVNREFSLQNARVTLDLFLRYDFPKSCEQGLSDYIEAGRQLERTYAQCRSRLAQAQARLANMQSRYNSQLERVEETRRQIEYCTIRAKAPGLVIYGAGDSGDAFRQMRGRGGGGGGSGIVAEGESVYTGQVLISMPDTAAMVAEISVHETEVDKVRAGQAARITMDAFPDRVLQGQVLEVAPLPDQNRNFLNPDLKVYQTLVLINGTHDFLKTRMSCRVDILVQELRDVLMVPIQVVSNRRGAKVVYVKTATGSQEREVTTGSFNDTFVQIVDGLKESEEVLLNPPLFAETVSGGFEQKMEFGPVDPNALAAPQPRTMPRGNRRGMPNGGEGQMGGEEMMRQMGERMGGEMTEERRQQMQQMMEQYRSRGGGQNSGFGGGQRGGRTGREARTETTPAEGM